MREVILKIENCGRGALYSVNVSFRVEESDIMVRVSGPNGELLAGPQKLGIAGDWLRELLEGK